ncbi:MAG TPA: hypothetical protein VFY68_12070 [Nitrososphaeraceae archaeon]|nr:hypothetical protein [Nitrososphaeraceae archaeon]
MCAEHKKEQGLHENHNLVTVGWSILVMGLSIAAVIILWMWFGHIGPTFSEDVLAEQQRMLRERYDLPAQRITEDPAELQTPPSLRNLEDNTTDINSNRTT